MAILPIFKPFGIFYGQWYNLSRFGIFFPHFGLLHQEKSGNPARNVSIFFSSSAFCCRKWKVLSSPQKEKRPFAALTFFRPVCNQGDQVSWRKNVAQNVAQCIFVEINALP
jgi:hypothetical protein